MSAEVREGVVDRITENGVVLAGNPLGYSKWFEGDRLTEAALGHAVKVVVDAGQKCVFLKKILAVGEKIHNWKPPVGPEKGSAGGGFRRTSPEELELKRAERVQIARSVAVDRAITLAKGGMSIQEIAPLAEVLEGYLLTGKFTLPPAAPSRPHGEPPMQETPPDDLPSKSPAPPPATPKPPPTSEKKPNSPPGTAAPKKAGTQAVNALFNEARRAGTVRDWKDYEALVREILKSAVKSPYGLTIEEFSRVELSLRPRFRVPRVA